MWICPVCQQTLTMVGATYRCAANHSFDISKYGYVHLLPSNRMHGKMPGDNKLMVRARRNFLTGGYYDRLAQTVADKVSQFSVGNTLLDIGCGEGYYTEFILRHLQRAGAQADVYGVDISKMAVELAARSYKDVHFSVGSAFHLPVADGSCGCTINLFAPYCGEEIRRIMKSDGAFIMAIPGSEHLWELKCALYDIPYKNEVKPFDLDGFDLVDATEIQYAISLPKQEIIQDLFMMTPYYYKTGVVDQQKLLDHHSMTVTAHFHVLVYRLGEGQEKRSSSV